MERSQAFGKAAAYCATAERCKDDVCRKLEAWDAAEHAEQILSDLEKEDFINEARYSTAFVRDKIRLQGWGKRKIAYALQNKHIPSSIIDKALNDSISQSEYISILEKLLREKYAKTKESSWASRIDKCKAFARTRGFETSLIVKCAENLNK